MITLPSDYYVKENLSCIVGTWNTITEEPETFTSTCVTDVDARTITFGNFLTSDWAALTSLNITVDSIVNPGTLGATNEIVVSTVNALTAGVVDSGIYTIADEYFKASNITDFLVEPKDFGVGTFPATYNFKFRANGEIHKASYIILTMPEEIEIFSKRGLERTCGDKIVNFTYVNIHCTLYGRKIYISNGFKNEKSDYMFDDGDLVPALYEFEIKWFRNPRSLQQTGAWDIEVRDSDNVLRYSWDESTAPTIRMTSPARPKKLFFQRGTRMNGQVTTYSFNVQTTNYL